MSDLSAAVKATREGGVALDVEVVPGARESRFPAGFNVWRARVEARVRAPPEEGQANAELVGLVAVALGVPPSAIRVTSGATSRKKTITVDGMTVARAVALLNAALAADTSL